MYENDLVPFLTSAQTGPVRGALGKGGVGGLEFE